MERRQPIRLTKSRFTQALSCPTKLAYIADDKYANQSIEDTFLEALAEGGFQVGELAKQYYQSGIAIETSDPVDALRQTSELLTNDEVTIFEAAIEFQNCFIRVDILEKKGQSIRLHEVKAKSFDGKAGAAFTKRDGSPNSEWKKYLYDVAFQKWVCMKALPKHLISAHLMLADKSKRTSSAGLNQKFRIQNRNGRKSIIIEGQVTPEDLKSKILTSINVDNVCAHIFGSTDHGLEMEETFDHMIDRFSQAIEKQKKIKTPIGLKCGSCEFICSATHKELGKKDGRAECFQHVLGLNADVLLEPTVFDLWNYRGKQKFIDDGIIKLADINEEDLHITAGVAGLSNSERQWLQIQKAKEDDDTVYIDKKGLRHEMSNWVYPLHFIDFETTMVAIPFGANRAPYEGIAFQFSHHMVSKDGTVTHAGEFLNVEPGYFPNYDFVRALKEQLAKDEGSIFRYSNHENTYLNIIRNQLLADENPPTDIVELVSFIETITTPPRNSEDTWVGERVMIDLLEILKKYYFDPRTNGSNSLKYVLPNILNRSEMLQAKYGAPSYGIKDGPYSKNFADWQWIKKNAQGAVLDPYLLLPKLFEDIEEEQVLLLTNDNELRNGGAALMAYARMQFETMSEYERDELKSALLKYCELDTLAMVMIYEAWKSELQV